MAKGIGFAEQFTPLSGIEIAEHSHRTRLAALESPRRKGCF
jgi:hypothetical protein